MTKQACRFLPLSSLLWFVLAMSAGATSYTLTVKTVGSGTITTNPTFATYPANVTVGLTATPQAGWYFGGWSGAVTGPANPVNVTMTGNLSVTGSFLAYPTYSLTLVTNGQGTVVLNPLGGNYVINTMVTATAAPAAGWVFAGWSGGTNATTNPLALAINNNLSLTGTFAQLPAFDLQPHGQTNAAGGTVSLSSHSVGTAPVAYQWFFNSGPLSGATHPTLTLTNATLSEAGFYQVVATNLYGSATSSVVTLVLTNAGESTNVVSVCDEASLAAAIRAGGWISIGCSGTITLTNTLTITNHVILDGSSVSAAISGGNAVRLFYVAPGASLSVTNLTLANGSFILTNGGAPAVAGAIYNDGGTLTLTACTLTNNTAQALTDGGWAGGGAIYNSGGVISLYETGISNNTVVGGEYVINIFGYPPAGGMGLGGALFTTNGVVVIANCVMTGNQCTGEGGGGGMLGGAVYQASGSMMATNSLWAANEALGGNAVYYFSNGQQFSSTDPGYGGALAASGGIVTINSSQFSGNLAQGGNNGYSPSPSALGGAIFSSATLTIANCTFHGNQALAGSSLVTFSRNVTGNGGAIYNLGSAMINQCCLYSNYAQGGSCIISFRGGVPQTGGDGLGGGIFNAGWLGVTNCTIVLNTAENGSGSEAFEGFGFAGPNGNALGGGLGNGAAATFSGLNVTIASNACLIQGVGTGGTAFGSQLANSGGTLQLRNSLLAYGGIPGNANGAISDLGDNISSDGSANFTSGSSFNFTDPLLGPLANNGGPTLTMALLPGSPALAYANSATAPPDDQRGFARPVGNGVIDLGAYQSGATQVYYPPPVLSIAAAFPNVVLSFTTSPSITNTLHLQSSGNLKVWTDLATYGALSSPSNISYTISQPGVPWHYYRLWW